MASTATVAGWATAAGAAGAAGSVYAEGLSSSEPCPEEEAPKSRYSESIDNQLEHLTQRDLDAARRELAGEVVKRKVSTGKPWDHVQEVRQAQTGLRNTINSIKNRLSYPQLDSAERPGLMADLARASRIYDRSIKFLPKGK